MSLLVVILISKGLIKRDWGCIDDEVEWVRFSCWLPPHHLCWDAGLMLLWCCRLAFIIPAAVAMRTSHNTIMWLEQWIIHWSSPHMPGYQALCGMMHSGVNFSCSDFFSPFRCLSWCLRFSNELPPTVVRKVHSFALSAFQHIIQVDTSVGFHLLAYKNSRNYALIVDFYFVMLLLFVNI